MSNKKDTNNMIIEEENEDNIPKGGAENEEAENEEAENEEAENEEAENEDDKKDAEKEEKEIEEKKKEDEDEDKEEDIDMMSDEKKSDEKEKDDMASIFLAELEKDITNRAIYFLKNVFQVYNPSERLCSLFKRYCVEYHDCPLSLDSLCQFNLEACPCGLIPYHMMQNAVETEVHNVLHTGDISSCFTIYHQTVFYLQEKHYPSDEDFIKYMEQVRTFSLNPEQHHQDNKVLLPTKNLYRLEPSIVEKDGDCCLCLETIQKGKLAFILPCKHVYHCDEKECVDGNIKTWLEFSKVCPMCKEEVVL